jgi:hypothetical protein
VARAQGAPSSGSSSAASPTATADDVPPATDGAKPPLRGWELGAGVGYAVTGGDAVEHLALQRLVTNAFAVTIDGGRRINRLLYLGGTFTVAPGTGMDADPACSQASCSKQDFQMAVEARFHFFFVGPFDFWAGGAVGWEVLMTHVSGQGGDASGTLSGPMGSLELGAEGRVGPVTLGPYYALSFGEYAFRSESPEPAGVSSSVTGGAVHEWNVFGLRGSYGPW